MIVRYACNYTDGRKVIGEVEFDASGKATIRRADDSYMRKALEEALRTPINGETGECRDGVLVSRPFVAEPGTVEHALAMVNPRILLQKGITTIATEGEMLRT